MHYYGDINDYLAHHGIVGQRWGIRNGPPYPLGQSSTRQTLENFSKELREIKYSDFTTLQPPEQTASKKSGSCHDQVMYELSELSKRGIQADARFVMEYDDQSNQGGMTHSFVYTKDQDGGILWLENAWGGKEGVHKFKDINQCENYIRKLHKSNKFGNSNKYKSIEFSSFKPEKHRYGENLQELVDICLSD